MSYRVEITSEAEQQLRDVSVWWAEHRPAARTTVKQAMEKLAEGLRQFPNAAPKYRSREVRYAPLRGTPYYAFFRVDDDARTVQVVAVWSVRRGGEPDL